MLLTDFEGEHHIISEDTLLQRLRTVRSGIYGAFILEHDIDGSKLWVHFNKDIACLHFFPEDEFAGVLTATGKTPQGLEGRLHFLQVNNSEADSFDLDSCATMNADDAYAAAKEYYYTREAPSAMDWIEL